MKTRRRSCGPPPAWHDRAVPPSRARRTVTEELATVDLPGGRLGYVLRRSSGARTMRVVIDPARGVVVTIPGPNRRGWARPEPLISAFLGEREAWLRRHLARQAAERAALAARGGLRDGATFRYRGELHRLRIETATGSRRSAVTRVGGDLEDGCTSASRPPTAARSGTSSRRGSARGRGTPSGEPSIGTPRR